MIDGHPGFLISREGAPVTRKGFINGYHFKRMSISGEERYQDKPNKNRFSHPHDATQYGAMKFAPEVITNSKKDDSKKVDMYNPIFRWQN
jgi:hypothetical protein